MAATAGALVERVGLIDYGGRAALKYVVGAICIWLLFGLVGAWLLGQQRLDVPTIAAGPISFWKGFDKPTDS